MTKIDEIASGILSDLVADFRAQALPAKKLSDGYKGVPMTTLRKAYGEGSEVDFDLAFSDLEKQKFVKTGPMAVIDNDRHSNVLILGMYSKREYAYLTDKGYKEAQRQAVVAPAKRSPGHSVAITHSTIYQSAIGAGDQFSQSVNVENEVEVIRHLSDLARSSGRVPEAEILDEVADLIAAAKAADMPKAKPIFQRLYGAAANGVGQVAWGVVSALIAANMGIG